MRTPKGFLIVVLVLAAAGCARSVAPPPYRVVEPADSARTGPAGMSPGDRVRVWWDGGYDATGELVAVDTLSLRLAPDTGGELVEVPVQSIGYLERSAGMRDHAAAGTLAGATLGAFAGLVLWASQWEPSFFGVGGNDPSDAFFLVPFFGGIVLGFVTGHNDRTEVWEPVLRDPGFHGGPARERGFWDYRGDDP